MKSNFFKVISFNKRNRNSKFFLLLNFEVKSTLMFFRHSAIFAKYRFTLALKTKQRDFFCTFITLGLIILFHWLAFNNKINTFESNIFRLFDFFLKVLRLICLVILITFGTVIV